MNATYVRRSSRTTVSRSLSAPRPCAASDGSNGEHSRDPAATRTLRTEGKTISSSIPDNSSARGASRATRSGGLRTSRWRA
jgi:hypothetical protein